MDLFLWWWDRSLAFHELCALYAGTGTFTLSANMMPSLRFTHSSCGTCCVNLCCPVVVEIYGWWWGWGFLLGSRCDIRSEGLPKNDIATPWGTPSLSRHIINFVPRITSLLPIESINISSPSTISSFYCENYPKSCSRHQAPSLQSLPQKTQHSHVNGELEATSHSPRKITNNSPRKH
jgi:hypothetical protein